jgi:hypothetical protein
VLLLHLLAPSAPNRSSSSTSLGAAPLLPSLPLSGLARRQVPGPGRTVFAGWGGEAGEPPSTRLPHGLNRSYGVLEPDEPASVDGSADGGGGGGATRVGEVSESSGDGSIQSASGPWGRPLGPMVMCIVRWTTGTSSGPVTTMIRRSSASSSLPSSSP